MRRFTILASLAMLATPVSAQTPPVSVTTAVVLDPAAARRVAELPALLAGTADPATVFAPEFLAQVPAAQVTALTAQLRAASGPVGAVERIDPHSPWSAGVEVGYAKGVATIEIVVAPDAPNRITGLRIKGLLPRVSSLAEIDAALAALPGTTGLMLAKLGDGAPAPVVARNGTRAFAIGSEFKLVILAELVRAIEAGERRWDEEVVLDGVPLPGGLFATAPKGTKVSIRDLAGRMISVSDNSATDILLRTLGRAKVEAMLPVVGIADPKAMRPFLGTLELFKLKGVEGGALGRRYAAANEAGRRALLAGPVAAAPISAIDADLFKAGKPLQIETLEWFATPNDMVRVMDWLRRHTGRGPAAEARAILAKNPAVGAAAERWRYVGYKGGSEPGVMAMTFLLQAKDGGWWALSGSWNDPAAAVDEVKFAGLVARAVELAAPTP